MSHIWFIPRDDGCHKRIVENTRSEHESSRNGDCTTEQFPTYEANQYWFISGRLFVMLIVVSLRDLGVMGYNHVKNDQLLSSAYGL